jgi:hypothetical protein
MLDITLSVDCLRHSDAHRELEGRRGGCGGAGERGHVVPELRGGNPPQREDR